MVAYVAMGLVGRVVPQIQLFVVGFPLTIAVSLLITAMSLGMFVKYLEGMMMDMFRDVSSLMNGMT